MWPISYKAGIKKMRAYRKRKRLIKEVKAEDTLDLLPLLLTCPNKV
jgi:hypothetical protein